PSAPSAITFSNITANSFKIGWTNGNGVGRLVVMKEGAAVDMSPANGTGYTANSVFGTGNDMGNSNFVVHNGAGNSVNVSGLKEGVTYHVAVYDLNGICYSSALTGSQVTAGCAILPDIAANPASETTCNGGTTTIALSSSDANATFSWTVVASGVTGAAAGTGSSISQKLTLTASATGTAKYTVTPKSGVCKGTPITVDITVEPPPTAFTVTGGGSICEGSGNTVPIGLDGSQSGLNYVLYRGTSTVETVVGTGGALNFSPTDIPGDYSVEVVRSAGCANVMNGSVSVVIDPSPVLSGTVLGATIACQGEISKQYSVNDPGGITYNWTFPAGFTIVSGDGTSTVIVDISSTATSGIVSVTATNSCATTPALTLDVTVNPGFDITIIKADTIYAGKDTPFSLETTATLSQVAWNFGDTDLSADIAPVHVYTEPGNYVVSALATANDGCTRNSEISIAVGELAPIHIHNVVTPNGDGKNDVLYIENVTFYPGCEVVVLDRWGIKIKSFTDYKNEWDLTTDNGEVLPAGNYLCVVKIPGEKIYSRTITVITE
ncbi:MAG: gliding motility-associated C-terminal domain-containing protein, partial [Cyclobacteriaceae bacterium]|nr:gliding motility-associated C-terminal domain-containing protein [Cyclobacteriaceae bacterium]